MTEGGGKSGFNPLDMVMGGGFPGFTGGASGPAYSSVSGNPYFYAPFNVSGSGGKSSSASTPMAGGMDMGMIVLLAAVAGAAFLIGGKK